MYTCVCVFMCAFIVVVVVVSGCSLATCVCVFCAHDCSAFTQKHCVREAQWRQHTSERASGNSGGIRIDSQWQRLRERATNAVRAGRVRAEKGSSHARGRELTSRSSTRRAPARSVAHSSHNSKRTDCHIKVRARPSAESSKRIPANSAPHNSSSSCSTNSHLILTSSLARLRRCPYQ